MLEKYAFLGKISLYYFYFIIFNHFYLSGSTCTWYRFKNFIAFTVKSKPYYTFPSELAAFPRGNHCYQFLVKAEITLCTNQHLQYLSSHTTIYLSTYLIICIPIFIIIYLHTNGRILCTLLFNYS